MTDGATPPHLVPGMSAFRWLEIQVVWDILCPIVFVAFGVYVGYIVPTQAERDAASAWWLMAIAVMVIGWLALVVGFRRAAYRERAAGYTTIAGHHVSVPVPRTEIRLFSTIDLWLLDGRTGAVKRRPGEPGR